MMITQGEVMIPQTEVVALSLEGMGDEVSSCLLAQTLNFLRCGVSAVQWILAENWDATNDRSMSRIFTENLHDRLMMVQQDGERFKLATPDTVDNQCWRRGAVLTITRDVEPMAEETKFGLLKRGDIFRFHHNDQDVVCMVTAGDSASFNDGVYLQGKNVYIGKREQVPSDLMVIKLLK
jgi:hypothetical protein